MKRTVLMIIIALICGTTVFTGCHKDENENAASVFVAGQSGNSAVLWKNGIAHDLVGTSTKSTGEYRTWANSVYVSGRDVYVAGSISTIENEQEAHIAVLWKNGKAQYLTDATTNPSVAKSVFVTGNDIYIAGRDDGDATLWKNGESQVLVDIGIVTTNSVYVSGSDVYVAGHNYKYAILWKNGEAQYLASGINFASANSVYVSGNDVYVVGMEWKFDDNSGIMTGAIPRLWKNGVRQNLAYGTDAQCVFENNTNWQCYN